MTDALPPGKLSPGSHVARPPAGALAVSGSTPLTLLIGPLQFAPDDPFYELVTAFVSATAGQTPVFDAEGYPTFLDGITGVYSGSIASSISWDLGKTVRDVRGGAINANQVVNLMCCMLANSSYELALARWGDASLMLPEAQLLRHVRHAASHGNRWHFSDGKPNRPARWRSLDLESSEKGPHHPRHGKQCFGVDLGPADLLALLFDLQKLLP